MDFQGWLGNSDDDAPSRRLTYNNLSIIWSLDCEFTDLAVLDFDTHIVLDHLTMRNDSYTFALVFLLEVLQLSELTVLHALFRIHCDSLFTEVLEHFQGMFLEELVIVTLFFRNTRVNPMTERRFKLIKIPARRIVDFGEVPGMVVGC